MTKTTKTVGYILMLLGGISYFATNMVSPTALIPAFFGIVFLGLGILAEKKESMRKHVMHAAVLLAVIGFAGSVGGLTDILGALGGSTIERPAAAVARSLMAIICIFYVTLGVKSFVAARQQASS